MPWVFRAFGVARMPRVFRASGVARMPRVFRASGVDHRLRPDRTFSALPAFRVLPVHQLPWEQCLCTRLRRSRRAPTPAETALSGPEPMVSAMTNFHHAIDYVELPVSDLSTAKAFYEQAFGWQFNDYGPAYAGIRAPSGDGEVGGLNGTAARSSTRRWFCSTPTISTRRWMPSERPAGRWSPIRTSSRAADGSISPTRAAPNSGSGRAREPSVEGTRRRRVPLGSAQRDDDGRGDTGVMGDRDPPVGDAHRGGRGGDGCADLSPAGRSPPRRPGSRASPSRRHAERLGGGLLDREPGGQRGRPAWVPGRGDLLAGGEQPARERRCPASATRRTGRPRRRRSRRRQPLPGRAPRAARMHRRQPVAYSTVTDLARFRGLSMS